MHSEWFFEVNSISQFWVFTKSFQLPVASKVEISGERFTEFWSHLQQFFGRKNGFITISRLQKRDCLLPTTDIWLQISTLYISPGNPAQKLTLSKNSFEGIDFHSSEIEWKTAFLLILLEVESRWNPGGIQVESRLNPGGFQVETRWNPGVKLRYMLKGRNKARCCCCCLQNRLFNHFHHDCYHHDTVKIMIFIITTASSNISGGFLSAPIWCCILPTNWSDIHGRWEPLAKFHAAHQIASIAVLPIAAAIVWQSHECSQSMYGRQQKSLWKNEAFCWSLSKARHL